MKESILFVWGILLATAMAPAVNAFLALAYLGKEETDRQEPKDEEGPGQYLEAPVFPSRIGYEAAGIVDAVGPGVDGIQIGDRVSTIPSFSVGKYGVYGESAIVPAHSVAGYPDTLSAVEGAAIWMQYMTAFGALVEYGRLKKEDAVLITAASSSVGLAAIQIAKYIGALAVATTFCFPSSRNAASRPRNALMYCRRLFEPGRWSSIARVSVA